MVSPTRTIFYEVADLIKPAAEPFMVVRIDVAIRKGAGCEGTVMSLHWQRNEAEARARELSEEEANCHDLHYSLRVVS